MIFDCSRSSSVAETEVPQGINYRKASIQALEVKASPMPEPHDELEEITPASEVLSQLAKMKLALSPEIRYKLESVFPKTTGWGAAGEIKRRAKLIRKVEPTLDDMLLSGEEVLYVAKGVQYSFAESYFMGALWANLLNQTVFVLTNLRLLMMRSRSNGTPEPTFWVIYYSEIEEFKPTWTGILRLRLRDKTKLTFTGFPRLDRQSMPAIFQGALDRYKQMGFEPAVSQSRENLCCECFKVVPKDRFVCRHCGTEYWRPSQLAFRSLAFPSWGDFCMGHYGIACMELLGYVISWLVAIGALTGPDTMAGVIVAGVIFLFEHPFDAILTHTIAKKGLHLRRGPDDERAQQERDDGQDDNEDAEDLDGLDEATSEE